MIPKIEDCSHWKRKDNKLIAVKTNGEEIPLVKFTFSRFIDLKELTEAGCAYMERYVAGSPAKHYEILYNPEKENEQLSFF